MRASLCVLKIHPVRSVRIGCRRPGRLKRKPTNRSADVRRQKRQRSPKSEIRWTTRLRYTLQKRCFNFLPSVRATGHPWRREPRQPQVLGQRLRRWSNLPGGLPGPLSPRSPWLPACLWWDGPGPTVVPGPRGRSPQITKWGPTDARTPQGPIILLDTTMDVKRGSGPGPRHRVGPAPGGRLIRRVFRGRAVSLRGRRMSGLQGLPLIPITIIASQRVILGPCLHHHRRRQQIASLHLVIIKMEDVKVLRGLVHPTSPDGSYSCPQPLPSHHGDSFAGPARTRWRICSWSGRPSKFDGSDRGCGRPSKWRPGRWRLGKWRPSRWRPSIWRVSKGTRHGHGWRAGHRGWARGSCRPSKSTVRKRRPSTWWWRPGRCGQPSTPSEPGSGWPSSCGWSGGPWYSSREHASCRTGLIHVVGCQQSSVPVIAKSDQPDYVDWFHVHVDFDAASDGPGYGCSFCPGQAHCTVNRSYAQRWWHPTQKVQDST